MSLTPANVRSSERYTCTIHQSVCNCKELWVVDKRLVASVAVDNEIPTAPVTYEEARSVDHSELIKGFPRRLISSFIQQNKELPTCLSSRLRNLAIQGTPLREPTLPKHLPLTAPIPNQLLELDIEMSMNGDHQNPDDGIPLIELDPDDDIGDQLDDLDAELNNSILNLNTAMENTDALVKQIQQLKVGDIPVLPDITLPDTSSLSGPSKAANVASPTKTPSMSGDLPGQHYVREINSYIDDINYMLDHDDPELIEKTDMLDDFCTLLDQADDAIEDIRLKGHNLSQLSDQMKVDQIVDNLNSPILSRLNFVKNHGHGILKTVIRAARYLMTYIENKTTDKLCQRLDKRLDPLVKPLHDLSNVCNSLDVTNATVNKRIENLETKLDTMQHVLSSLTVQLTTLNHTIANLKFENAKSTLVSDIPSTSKQIPKKQPVTPLHEPANAISLAELIMYETCTFTKSDTKKAEKYLTDILVKFPKLEEYMKAARELSHCSVPDHYLIGCYLATQDNYKEKYKQTNEHLKLIYPGNPTDKQKLQTFMINILVSDMAKLAAKSDRAASNMRFSGCPPEGNPPVRKPVSFLKSLGI